MSGEEVGFYTLPDVNDEVLVGFIAEDPSHPVILGGVWTTPCASPFDMRPCFAATQVQPGQGGLVAQPAEAEQIPVRARLADVSQGSLQNHRRMSRDGAEK